MNAYRFGFVFGVITVFLAGIQFPQLRYPPPQKWIVLFLLLSLLLSGSFIIKQKHFGWILLIASQSISVILQFLALFVANERLLSPNLIIYSAWLMIGVVYYVRKRKLMT